MSDEPKLAGPPTFEQLAKPKKGATVVSSGDMYVVALHETGGMFFLSKLIIPEKGMPAGAFAAAVHIYADQVVDHLRGTGAIAPDWATEKDLKIAELRDLIRRAEPHIADDPRLEPLIGEMRKAIE